MQFKPALAVLTLLIVGSSVVHAEPRVDRNCESGVTTSGTILIQRKWDSPVLYFDGDMGGAYRVGQNGRNSIPRDNFVSAAAR